MVATLTIPHRGVPQRLAQQWSNAPWNRAHGQPNLTSLPRRRLFRPDYEAVSNLPRGEGLPRARRGRATGGPVSAPLLADRLQPAVRAPTDPRYLTQPPGQFQVPGSGRAFVTAFPRGSAANRGHTRPMPRPEDPGPRPNAYQPVDAYAAMSLRRSRGRPFCRSRSFRRVLSASPGGHSHDFTVGNGTHQNARHHHGGRPDRHATPSLAAMNVVDGQVPGAELEDERLVLPSSTADDREERTRLSQPNPRGLSALGSPRPLQEFSERSGTKTGTGAAVGVHPVLRRRADDGRDRTRIA